MNGWMDGQRDGRKDGCIDKWTEIPSHRDARAHPNNQFLRFKDEEHQIFSFFHFIPKLSFARWFLLFRFITVHIVIYLYPSVLLSAVLP